MTENGRLAAVQLANQQLAQSARKLEEENAQLRAENAQLKEERARLQKSLRQMEEAHETVKREYQRATGRPYSGRLQTSMFGFSKATQ